mgnify:FL=1
MNFIDYEKKQELLFPIAVKGLNLHIHSNGKPSFDKNDLKTTSENMFKGIEDKNEILIGAFDLRHSKSLVVDIAAFMDTVEKDHLKEFSALLLKKMKAAGFRKIEMTIFCGVPEIADVLKEDGFLPEVKYRSHLFIGGKIFPITQYGVFL